MSKKGDHPLLQRLINLVELHLPFADQVAQLRRQHQWLVDLEHLLDPTQYNQPPTSQDVAQAVHRYLVDLMTQVRTKGDAQDQAVVSRIEEAFRNHWWGLFTCYDVTDLPRTNNELERYFRWIKMGQRRISGRKNVHQSIIRYGPYLTCIDLQENLTDLLARLQHVSQDDFLRERQILGAILLREQKRHRFRYHRTTYLAELEARWAAAIETSVS